MNIRERGKIGGWVRQRVWVWMMVWMLVGVEVEGAALAPSGTSKVGDTVLNVVTGAEVKVTELVLDPEAAPGDPALAFVKTDDGYVILVRNQVGNVIYNNDPIPVAFTVVASDAAAKTVTLRLASDAGAPTAAFSYAVTTAEYTAQFNSAETPGELTPPVVVTGADGVRIVNTGDGGSNGRDGALFVPPTSGRDGKVGPTAIYTNNLNISTTNKIGIEVGSIGGRGGAGGDSYASFWSGRDGGDGGAGGTVIVSNPGPYQVATTGSDKHGIFAYSKGGAAGNGGSGFAAPGGGTGGHSSDGGSVTVSNGGTVITTGSGAIGIYALSVSNNGGSGGSTWGLVGTAGSGGYGGSGGAVAVTNLASGVISTSGALGHGILAQSIGGSGGSAGTSGNLLVSLNGSGDNGGNGGTVTVTNQGDILTTGSEARGIFAQSIGGGGGSGGGSWGLVALGGAGSNGGNGSTVTVSNTLGAVIQTSGAKADGIFAQSIGGSGGSGANAGGLFALGGRGSRAGNGGAVSVSNFGTITADGAGARGIVAQSIGGGGGDGGNSGGMVAVGGNGAGGGTSATVTVQHGGTIWTKGVDGRGILAQSVGGGGGNGGSGGSVSAFAGVAIGGTGGGGGAGGNVVLTLQGENVNVASLVKTEGDRATGVFGQSVGGGGGTGGGAVQVTGGFVGAASVAIGGTGGSGGAGGLVTMSKGLGRSDIVTGGADSGGVFLQSVGGGGGDGGYSVSVAASAGPISGAFGLALGGKGGTGGAGGEVRVGNFDASRNLTATGFHGNILTQGDRSVGFLAQSVGGGGGNGGLAVSAAASFSMGTSGSIGMSMGGSGAGGGNGGLVRVGTEGDITTYGKFSTGLLAQSVGGGGGNGGTSIAATLAGSVAGAGAISLAFGGSAANGGLGGEVVAASRSGLIQTYGDHSAGIVVQSVGGGGGNGGLAVAGSAAGSGGISGNISSGVGGDGGAGGFGGRVTADLRSDVITGGSGSGGVIVQSIGGGGGNSGLTVAAGGSYGAVGAGGVSVGIGGSGGNGGSSDLVNLLYQGSLRTSGSNSVGILAQSVGGGGGNASGTISASLNGGGTGSGAVSVGIGGSGGVAGHGGRADTATAVTLTASGVVWTSGANSSGVVAQSIGGGGGNGGYTINSTLSIGGVGSGAVSLGIGGSGGGGGTGKGVLSDVSSDIITEGDDSFGFLTQSVGGGGGNGGFSINVAGSGGGVGSGGVAIGLGGSGAGGGGAGAVNATASGTIFTSGMRSTAFVAQSIGGGGGNGGYNVAVPMSYGGTGGGSVAVGLGGSGAGGGNGGAVVAATSGNIVTAGRFSGGILAQSVGGGGGNGGYNINVAGSGAGTGSGAVAVGLGGSGAGGGNGSSVGLTVANDVTTFGDDAVAIIAQSVGGGGGNGGYDITVTGSVAETGSGAVGVSLGGSAGSGGLAGAVNSNVTGNLWTAGKNSGGLLVQSVGGGGGNGGYSVSATISGAGSGSGAVGVSIGGTGGGGGVAGNVFSTHRGNVTTGGENSTGVVAQSIGGGGGNGGVAVAGVVSLATSGGGGGVSLGIGGSGGGGGNSGTVDNRVDGRIFTYGANSGGVLAQSLGGGGGNGGLSVSGAVSLASDGSGAVAIGLGGSGGGGGDGSTVNNTVGGYVQTAGANSAGVLAQSVGGGGGNGGLNVSGTFSASKSDSGSVAVGLGGSGGDGGNGALVTSMVTGGVLTHGNDSAGIIAQSLGGGGGNGGLNVSGAINLSKAGGGAVAVGIGGSGGGGGDAGNVSSTVRTTALYEQIGTLGDNSSAVVAQSIGGGGGNGGLNVSGAVNISAESGAAIGVGLGGFGGGGGRSGDVFLDVVGQVLTEGNNSHGLLAQSIGGGGGNGGVNVSGTLSVAYSEGSTVAASVGIGGFGGAGGDAGKVSVAFDGRVVAQPRIWVPDVEVGADETIPGYFAFKDGPGSHGLAAQSIGGGGGNGGINVSGGIAVAGGDADGYGLVVGFGGYGGGGGDADDVDVTVTGGQNIAAYGAGHSGIFAQSLGGGGGNGALNVSGGIVSDSSLLFGIGGAAGDAGVAKDVVVNATADVFAGAVDSLGLTSAGILAQSLGGGGGNGGMNVTGGLSISKEGSVPSVTVGIGGLGGSGARSGNVTVNHSGSASTWGEWIHGVMAQSIAGGGGNGGINISGQLNFADSANSGGKTDLSVVAGVGGNGGAGADAGNASVINSGTVSTSGAYARGVVAQSIGGGGGNGGLNITGVFAENSSPIAVGVGGSGSGGGHAGTATVNRGLLGQSAGAITTNGLAAYGIEASSIGGGGGNAGMNFVVGVTTVGKKAGSEGFAAQFVIGGAGGSAGNGNAAAVSNFSSIETFQKSSHGILAQSIGGGGGNANFNIGAVYANSAPEKKDNANLGFNMALGGATGDGGYGGTVDVLHVGDIFTHGEDAYGILSQSIGGGGGNAGMDIAYTKADGGKAGISIGRVGGTGGYGSRVTLNSTGTVVTSGKGSFGLLAQSIGNGGGNSSSTSISIEGPDKKTSPAQGGSLAVGLEGGTGGRGGDVELRAAGWIDTSGEKAHAIFAQSVGGGGGNGGDAKTAGLSASTASLSLGGTGGTGGIGGLVEVISSAQVRTGGADAVGILAQSVGGGGGSGGMAVTGGLRSKVGGVSVAVGGGGGSGMAGGLVNVTNSGMIITNGEGGHGVLAQSLGGGGGNSGMTINAILVDSAQKGTTWRGQLSVGGTGGDGAKGGNVTVTNTGGIGTAEEGAIGILAQSLGGGGGNAKSVITLASTGEEGGNRLTMGIGGSGGSGASGGMVRVLNNRLIGDLNSAKIITLGNYSHGIMAMSIGGGGGTGSTTMNFQASAAPTKSASNSFGFALGGMGGEGGTGGAVEVVNQGEITTYGYRAHGIIAQSVGGGGGNGGMAITGEASLANENDGTTGSLALGGFGGDGNRSGNVTVNNSGSIAVFGDRSNGIYAQSVGGGGGDGGFAMTLSRDALTNPFKDPTKALLTLAMGGNGGDGADSGDVRIDHTGTIIVAGDNGYGIFAQTLGGGGGNVGHSLTNPAWMATEMAFSALIGSRDGTNGTAGKVTLNTSGDIYLYGRNSIGQFSQSINGGGGNAELFLDVSQQAVGLGDNGFKLLNNGGDVDRVKAVVTSTIGIGAKYVSGAVGSLVDVTHVGDIYSSARNGIASVIQSIGGGGGNTAQEIVVDSQADVNLELALGASQGAGNHGGNVAVVHRGNVQTAGNDSQGGMVQSIGGGGGNLSVEVRRVADEVVPVAAMGFAPEVMSPAFVPLASASALLGGDDGTDSNGGLINLVSSGDLSTAGERSYGKIIQSIGAGGGNYKFTGLDLLDVEVGSKNGSSGNGGGIIVKNTGAMTTSGGLAHGFIVQSIGGGGGTVFSDMEEDQIGLVLNSDNSGDGGNIVFEQKGDIGVTGDRSIGIILQSLAGGGGIVDRMFADSAGGAGVSGDISLLLDGDVLALGQAGIGAFVQSRGRDGQGDIDVTLTAGKTLYAGFGGIGLQLSGGNNNRFTSHGAMGTKDKLSGMVIRGEEGNDVVSNHGIFLGQFDLGAGTNSFTNELAGLFIPGAELKLGASGNLLTNHGAMRIGDTLLAQHSELTGSFVQSASGVTFAELDFGSNMLDRIWMDGTAVLSGEVDVRLLNPQLVPVGHFQKYLFHADSGLVDDGLFLTTAPSMVITYQLLFPTGFDAILDYNVDFSPNGGRLGRNLREVGDYFNRIQHAGSSPALADTVIELLYIPNIEDYKAALSQLGPDFYGEQQAEMIRSSQRFEQIMAGGGGPMRVVDGKRTLWFTYENDKNTHEANGDYKEVNHYTDRYAVGINQVFGDDWNGGLGLSSDSNMASGYDGRWNSKGTTKHLGVALNKHFGATEVTGVLSYGWNETRSERTGQVTDAYATDVVRDLVTQAAMLRFAHQFDFGSAYLRPIVDLGATRLKIESTRETGAGAINLVLPDYDEVHAWIHPSLTLGDIQPLGSARVHFYAEVGMQYFLTGERTRVVAGFQGAPAGVDPMKLPIDLGSYIHATLGVDLITRDHATFGFEYSKLSDGNYDLDRWGFRMSLPF